MNKYEYAIKYVYDDDRGQEAYDLIKELVERATPKKVVYKSVYSACENCGKGTALLVHNTKAKYCWNCGQALDWSDK